MIALLCFPRSVVVPYLLTNFIMISCGWFLFAAAARALVDIEGLSADDIASKSMQIASDICVYTNSNYTIETLDN